MYRFFDRSRENLSRGGARDYGRDSLGLRDGSEMVVNDACVKGKASSMSTKVLCGVGVDSEGLCKCFVCAFFLFLPFPILSHAA